MIFSEYLVFLEVKKQQHGKIVPWLSCNRNHLAHRLLKTSCCLRTMIWVRQISRASR